VAGGRCDAGLLRELESWRHDGEPERGVDVFVTYAGDPAALTAAGLELGHHDGEVATGTVRLADVAVLEAVPGVRWLAASARTHLLIDRSMPEIKATAVRAQAPPYSVGGTPGVTGKGVLVGILDNRLTVTHPTFTVPGVVPPKSRVIGYWDQVSRPEAGQGPPPGFPYGVWWDQTAVADVVANNRMNAIWTSSQSDHGSHVAGIAAGSGAGGDAGLPPFRLVGVAPEADIVFANSAMVLSAKAASDALQFVFGLAAQRGQPCVVNMSFGTHEGARDGSSALELAIDRLLHDGAGNPLPGRAVVVAAGNEADIRRHGRKDIPAFGTATFRLDVEPIEFPNGFALPTDNAEDNLYLWYDGAAKLEARISPPRFNPSAWNPPGMTSTVSIAGTKVAVIAGNAGPEPNGKRKIDLSLPGPVRQGHWVLELHETAGHAATVDLWVERSDIDGYPQLAYGDIVKDNTITCPNSARGVISVGNYTAEPGDPRLREHYGEIYRSSSWGIDGTWGATPDQVRPHVVAPGRRIISASVGAPVHEDYVRGRFAGITLRRHVVETGTSQAAPHVTGAVALMFQKNPTLTYRQVRDILAATARKDQIPPEFVLPNAVWGAGKLDVAAALAATLAP
jgi:subtilisin family serine protease